MSLAFFLALCQLAIAFFAAAYDYDAPADQDQLCPISLREHASCHALKTKENDIIAGHICLVAFPNNIMHISASASEGYTLFRTEVRIGEDFAKGSDEQQEERFPNYSQQLAGEEVAHWDIPTNTSKAKRVCVDGQAELRLSLVAHAILSDDHTMDVDEQQRRGSIDMNNTIDAFVFGGDLLEEAPWYTTFDVTVQCACLEQPGVIEEDSSSSVIGEAYLRGRRSLI